MAQASISVVNTDRRTFLCLVGNPTARALRRRVQIALKPAAKGLGLHRIFIRGKGRKYVIADSTFKRMQVDAWACWLDAGEHHRGPALRTGGAPKCNRWNGGRQALRLGHNAFPLEQAGAQYSLSPVMPGRRSGDGASMRRRDLKRELIRTPASSPAQVPGQPKSRMLVEISQPGFQNWDHS